jgi:hypothetical protein
MTQMIGRALRGVEAGGTKKAYIVSFIDNGLENIAWSNPDSIFEGNNDFADTKIEYEKRDIRLISISKIEEFAKMLNDSVDTSELEKIPFNQRIPIGMYAFTNNDTSYQVMVYNSTQKAYEQLMQSLPDLFNEYNSGEEEIPSYLLSEMAEQCRNTFFLGEMIPPYDEKDIISLQNSMTYMKDLKRNGKLNDRSIVIFDYKPTRKGENAQAFLKGFDGYLVRDGYSGYHVVTGVKHCGCMTHVRRYFVNALPKDKSAQETSVAAEAVRYFERIYHEENLLSDMTAEDRYEQRLVKVKPLLDAFFAWLETLQVSGKSALAKATAYALNEKPYLYTFLENGNVPIDNNRAENAIRPFAVGRKNWMHSNTANGAKCSAALYSIVATAQANGLNTEQYLTELFSQPAGTILLPFNT